jgi:hypothetical protein
MDRGYSPQHFIHAILGNKLTLRIIPIKLFQYEFCKNVMRAEFYIITTKYPVETYQLHSL